MSLNAHMIHQCTIKRNESAIEDVFGGPATPSMINVYQGICRLVEKQQRVYSSETASLISVTVYKLFLPSSALVQDRDVVTSITVDTNNILLNAFVVKQELKRRTKAMTFISVDLQRAS